MYLFNQLGLNVSRFINSISLFFIFLGHLCHSAKDFLLRRLSISWFNVVKTLYYSGATLVIPLSIISALISISLSLNAYSIFNRLNLSSKALSISQDILTQDILPLLIGFVLCVQSALNIITARIRISKRNHTPEEVILEYILPIMIGIDITALLLYTYILLVIFTSLYFTFHYLLHFPTQEYLLQIEQTTTIIEVFHSVIKTLLNCTIVSLTAGYYYYQAVVNQISIRKAVSRILTRGALWLTVISVCWKLNL